jgi:hypothetical protein
VRFVGVPPNYAFVTIVLQVIQEGSEIADESIAWFMVAAFLE